MKPFDNRSAFAIFAMALLSACGGSSPPDEGQVTTAALMAQGNAPRADCEAEGCNRPRIIDGLAEQYRASAIEQQAQLSEPVAAQPGAAPEQPAAPAAAAIPVQDAPGAAPPAAAIQTQ